MVIPDTQLWQQAWRGLPDKTGTTDLLSVQGVLFQLSPLLAIAGAPILAAACPVALASRLARLRGLEVQHERLAGALGFTHLPPGSLSWQGA